MAQPTGLPSLNKEITYLLTYLLTTIKAWMSLLFCHFFSVAIDLTFFKLADKEEMYNILDVFEFRLDWTTDKEIGQRVTCPCLDYPKIHLLSGELLKIFL